MKERIEALSDLHTRLVDSRDGYEQAAKAANSGHASLFASQIERRSRNAEEVKGYIQRAGGTVDDDGSLLAAAHRTWLSLKDTVTSGDDAVLSEVVRGEETLLEAYDEAIAAAGAGDPELKWLTDQYEDLKSMVNGLKNDQAKAA